MTKTELIELLNAWPDNVVIAVASDAEGNHKRKLAAWDIMYVDDPTAWALEDHEYSAEDVVDDPDYTKVLVLYP